MIMPGERSKNILLHIDDAQAWLLRAKVSYQSDNTIRGEMDLGLAQAETRYAWELSRGRVRAAAQPRRAAAARWWLPVAACLGLGLLAAVLLPRVLNYGPGGAAAERMLEATRPAANQEAGERIAGGDRHAPGAGEIVDAPDLTSPKPEPALKTAGAPKTVGAVKTAVAPKTAETVQPPKSPATDAREDEPPRDNPFLQTERQRPAGTAPGLGVDLGELERVAKEMLFVGEIGSGGQH